MAAASAVIVHRRNSEKAPPPPLGSAPENTLAAILSEADVAASSADAFLPAGLESDATNPKADKDSGSGWCDPDVSFDDKFVGGDWDGEKYGDVMCGFVTYTSIFATQADGCVELNGCANFFIFPYLKSFTLLITFVFLNLFVGIILDGFQSANESDRTIKPVSPEREGERERERGRERAGETGRKRRNAPTGELTTTRATRLRPTSRSSNRSGCITTTTRPRTSARRSL